MKRILIGVSALAIAATQAQAGGRLDTFKFTGESNFIPGFEDVEVVGIFWDDRCTNVSYTVDDIPAIGVAGTTIPASVWSGVMQTAFDSWNNIPTSYIEMNVVGDPVTIGNGVRRFDFINELTFETPAGSGFLASSPSTSLQADATFVAGDDIDGDGDSDVFDTGATSVSTCHDFDADGDIEFPAGDYLAGTILDNDVQYNNLLAGAGIVWELTPTSTLAGQTQRPTDIETVAVHEFGHSHGLAHSFINQISINDGTGSTMFPFIDIDDRFSEEGGRTLHADDIAWSSFIYPEGKVEGSAPSAVQPGDIAFQNAYKVIRGSYTQGGFGVLGGNISATETGANGRTLVSAYSGLARAFSDGTGVFVGDLTNSVISDQYVLPVPRGTYVLAMQALDGDPAATGNISITAQIGGILGQHGYPEEFRSSGPLESEIETNPGQSTPVNTRVRDQNNINVATNIDVTLRNAGALTNIGTGAAIGVTDVIYAERFSNAAVLSLLNSGATMTTATYRTGVFDASVVSVWKRASVRLGRVNTDGTATLGATLFGRNNFIGQDGDSTPLFFSNPTTVSANALAALQADPTLDVFVVLEALNDFPRADDPRPPLLGLQATAIGASSGQSYLSVAGGPLAVRDNGNWIVELNFTPNANTVN
ncbi:MAG: matrixin family metalloprotease [Parvularculaceae bacterium]|nr:matrixin family metalloprotease [Parvularculaceae bacterium]